MAFFDNVGKKISEKGQSAAQKAKGFAEASRINSLISGEEANINNNYYQIGKLFVSMHANDCEDEFKGMIDAIYKSTAKIAEYKEQVQIIKGIVKCEKCGADVPIQSAFCNSCGAPMPKRNTETKADPNSVICSKCGSSVKAGMRFCTCCGNVMDSIPAPVEKQAATGSTQAPVEIQITKVCPQCGEEETDPESFFCNSCGTRLINKEDFSAQDQPNQRRCPQCGYCTTDDSSDFCIECGTPLV